MGCGPPKEKEKEKNEKMKKYEYESKVEEFATPKGDTKRKISVDRAESVYLDVKENKQNVNDGQVTEKIVVKCEVCAEKEATTYCQSCLRIRIYCDKCFELNHTMETNKSHNKMKYDPNLNYTLCCPAHQNKNKELACLNCGISICPDCITTGEHSGHKMGSFKEGFQKIDEDIKASTVSYTVLYELADSTQQSVVTNISALIAKLEEMKSLTEANFKILEEAIHRKKTEALNFIEALMAEERKKLGMKESPATKLKKLLNECQEMTAKCAEVTKTEYETLSKNSLEIKELKIVLEKMMALAKPEETICRPLNLGYLVNDINNIVIPKSLADYKYEIEDEKNSKLISQWISENGSKKRAKKSEPSFKLLYKGTVDGFTASAFHSKCDDKSPTLTIVRSANNNVFGGFTSKLWGGKGYEADNTAFVFSLNHNMKFPIKHIQHAIWKDQNYGPVFGFKSDISICDRSNVVNSSFSRGNDSYGLPNAIHGKSYLAETSEFLLKEIEVYLVIFE